MKITRIFTAVATAVTLALPGAWAIKKVALPQRNLNQDERELMTFTVVFEECVGMTLSECELEIQRQVDANPEIFEGRTKLDTSVRTSRTSEQATYYMVGMRTNIEESHVVGVLGDGMVFYPWEWCHAADECYTLGPWDCDIGTPLTVDECCNMVTASVPNADVNGMKLECFVDAPVGSKSNPTNYDRVLIHVNAQNIVLHPPRNE